jgi:hypothetical protein
MERGSRLPARLTGLEDELLRRFDSICWAGPVVDAGFF